MLSTKKVSIPGTKFNFKVNLGGGIIGGLLSIAIVVGFFVGFFGLFGLAFQDSLENLYAIFHQGQIKEVIGFWYATAIATIILFLVPRGGLFVLLLWLITQIICMVI